MECFLFKMFLCLRVTVCYVSLLGFFVFFLSLIAGLGQDFSCEEKEHTTVSRESKCKALNVNYH